MNEQILQEISEFCRQRGLAESTFGRRAVNDGKLASRLRNGGRITTDTLQRIRQFMTDNSEITGLRSAACAPLFAAMKARMRSSVSVVMGPPLRRRLASLPSLTARRPKVDSASPVWRQKSEISRRMASFMGEL